jgi:hypothetical protein
MNLLFGTFRHAWRVAGRLAETSVKHSGVPVDVLVLVLVVVAVAVAAAVATAVTVTVTAEAEAADLPREAGEMGSELPECDLTRRAVGIAHGEPRQKGVHVLVNVHHAWRDEQICLSVNPPWNGYLCRASCRASQQ